MTCSPIFLPKGRTYIFCHQSCSLASYVIYGGIQNFVCFSWRLLVFPFPLSHFTFIDSPYTSSHLLFFSSFSSLSFSVFTFLLEEKKKKKEKNKNKKTSCLHSPSSKQTLWLILFSWTVAALHSVMYFHVFVTYPNFLNRDTQQDCFLGYKALS